MKKKTLQYRNVTWKFRSNTPKTKTTATRWKYRVKLLSKKSKKATTAATAAAAEQWNIHTNISSIHQFDRFWSLHNRGGRDSRKRRRLAIWLNAAHYRSMMQCNANQTIIWQYAVCPSLFVSFTHTSKRFIFLKTKKLCNFSLSLSLSLCLSLSISKTIIALR